MSATFFGGEIKYTKRYQLGQLLSTLTRHFLLMTATPHNGKEEDFQLFMALLDGDRFEGRFRDGVHAADVSDLMRRMVKENLLKFDGTPLFPERIAYTVPYKLSRRRGPALQGSHRLRARGVQPRRGARRTTSARARSALRSPSCSAAWPPRPRRSTSRCAAAASGWKAGCASWNCCSAAAAVAPAIAPLHAAGVARRRGRRGSGRRARQRGRRPPRRRSSTRPPPPAPSPSCKAEIATLQAPGGAGPDGAPQRRRTPSGASWPACSARSSRPRPSPTALAEQPTVAVRRQATIPTARQPVARARSWCIFTEHRDTLNYLENRITTLLGPHARPWS